MRSEGQTNETGHDRPGTDRVLLSASVRELVIELAHLEYQLRRADMAGASVDVRADLFRLAEREAAIVAELQRRQLPFTLGEGAMAAAPSLRQPEDLDELSAAWTDPSRPPDRQPARPVRRPSDRSADAQRHDDVLTEIEPAAMVDYPGAESQGTNPGALVDHLHRAVESRSVIGQAQGILMSQHRLTADQALEQLRLASQNRNRKLRDIAADLVEENTAAEGDPDDRRSHAHVGRSGTTR